LRLVSSGQHEFISHVTLCGKVVENQPART
jgi:hypothetical protein